MMALTLIMLRNHFEKSDFFGKISELIIMITSGLLIYAVASYFSGSLNILIKSSLLKRKKNDILPSA